MLLANRFGRTRVLKMRAKPKQASIRFISVAICILVVISNSQLFVLCIGQDGHVAIEAANSNYCGDLLASVSREASLTSAERASSSNKSSCGSCMDIPVGLVGAFKKPNRVNPTSLTPTTIIPVTINSCDFSKYQLALESFTPTPYFTPLRSIILLI